MIDLQGIDVIFQSEGRFVHAVNDVSLHVDPGEVFGIVGYSGAGKSTLVRTINLLQRPTNGRVIVKGQDMLALSSRDLRQARKKIGMIFQHFNLMESRTIYDNVAFPLKGSGLTREEKVNKVAELLDLVGLGSKTQAYPSQLSGGQKQRVAIARALANDPDILLCDEATSALDPKTTSSILDLLRSINEKLGLTIVIITHEMSVVKDLCHKVAVMEDGKVLEQGSILDMFTQPQKALTREFINTATHFDQEMVQVLSHPTTKRLIDQGSVVRLSFLGSETTEPVMSQIIRQYDVDVNILYGQVEILQEVPIGNLLISLEGDPEKVQEALDYLRTRQVAVQPVDDLLKEYAIEEVARI